MARLSVVASPLAILAPPASRFRPLAPYCPISWHLTAKPLPGWHPTAPHRRAPYCYSPAGTLLVILRSVDPSSVTPSRAIALPSWVLCNALDRCNDLHDRARGYSRPRVSMFSPVDDLASTPLSPRFGSLNRQFLLFWGACGRV